MNIALIKHPPPPPQPTTKLELATQIASENFPNISNMMRARRTSAFFVSSDAVTKGDQNWSLEHPGDLENLQGASAAAASTSSRSPQRSPLRSPQRSSSDPTRSGRSPVLRAALPPPAAGGVDLQELRNRQLG